MKPSNRRQLKTREAKKAKGEARASVPAGPDRALEVLRKSTNPLFQSAHLAWLIYRVNNR
jgi:hypothetical protein